MGKDEEHKRVIKQRSKLKQNKNKQHTYTVLAKLCLVVTDEKGQPASRPASQPALPGQQDPRIASFQ